MRNRFSTIVALSSAAVAAAFAVPAAASAEPIAMLAGSAANPSINLLDTARPTQVTALPITGTGASELLAGIDVRPATGVLYLATTEDVGADLTVRLYTVNLATGAATLASTVDKPVADGSSISIDFNPAANALRIISTANDNLRGNPDTGAFTVDTVISGGTVITGVAYDRSVAGATATTIYGVSLTDDNLVTSASPNAGEYTQVGLLGADITDVSGFDISPATNTPYLLAAGVTGPAQLHTVNPTTGVATRVAGPFVGNPTDIAVLAPSTIGLAAVTANAQERDGRLDVLFTRTGATTVAGSVDYATVDGTAKAGSDYTTTAGTVKFAIGETTKTISIPLTDDGTGDAGEVFTLALSNAAGANLGTALQTITIVETQVADKTAPNILVSDLGIKGYKYLLPNGMYTTFSCDEACKVVYTVRLGTSTYLSKQTGELKMGGVGEVKATNSILGKARLMKAMKSSKSGKLVALFAIQATDANGNKKTISRKFQIVR